MFIKKVLITIVVFVIASSCKSQGVVAAAQHFIGTLTPAQKLEAVYSFDIDARYDFHFFPVEGRKGITVNELDATQREAAMQLLRACVSKETAEKIGKIMKLENVLKVIEKRTPDDHFRDSGKYYFTIYGIPSDSTIWGWRFEGHHASFNFSAEKGKLVSGTPGFLGSNPAIVLDGPNKGEQILKDESDMGFALLHSLSAGQLQVARFDTAAPGDIVTYISRKAMLQNPVGIRYDAMTSAQQQQLLQLVHLYVYRYTHLFADDMLKEIEKAGLNNLSFGWAGFTEPGLGKPHYYRIQGPTFIIEYDNTQNNANHVHTVLRDLLHDYGGDPLLEHYRESHHVN